MRLMKRLTPGALVLTFVLTFVLAARVLLAARRGCGSRPCAS